MNSIEEKHLFVGMRRLHAMILTALFLVTPFSLQAGTYGGGSGTAADPYLIGTAAQLRELGATPGDWDKHFRLVANIDMSGETIEVIGAESPFFTGVFDGDGRALINLTQSRPGARIVGLFGVIRTGAEVRNLILESAAVTGGEWVGALAAINQGMVSGCYASGHVSGDRRVGGLVGGNSMSATILLCHAANEVHCTDYNAGGLAGQSNGSVMRSFATGNVQGMRYVGGLLGVNYTGGTVVECHASGSVSGTKYSGGLVGQNASTIADCYAVGAVSALLNPGGLVATDYFGTVTSSFWDMEASGQTSSAGGTGKTTVEMYQQATYVGWDFTTPVWTIVEGLNYPKLAAFAAGPPEIVVDVLAHDFGNVQLLETATVLITIANEGTGPLSLLDVSLSGDVSFAIDSPVPATLAAGECVELVVSCTPFEPGWIAATLAIESDDADEPLVEVTLQAFGSLAEMPSDEQVDAIITYVDDCVTEGSVVGDGPGSPTSNDKRLNALLNQLDAINDLIVEGAYDQACEQLAALYLKTDGLPKPPDFVAGEDAAALAQLILDLMASLSCE